MKHLVLKPFINKETGDLLFPASFYMSEDTAKVKKLSELGYIKLNEEALREDTPKRSTSRSKKVSDHNVTENKEVAKNDKRSV
ncbi:hypothetical protein [Lysinibacillus capsici]|uniref:hypothetical protein n=1 Tax=Lysinibacillus capsici TaxID=2115968 RepID=UPI000E20AFFE|nr:hypothetical protein [Lysinibacillus capsici]RDV27122.1 hypothetical protein C7B89_20005 [Lysinibacillus capsici]